MDVRQMLRNSREEYLAQYELARNAHMHEWRGEEPSRQVVQVYVDVVIEGAEFGSSRAGAVADALVAAAKRIGSQEGDLTKAILVDYANWAVGRHCGLDLALYAGDLA